MPFVLTEPRVPWDVLPSIHREGLIILGFVKETWDNGSFLSLFIIDWSELTPAKRDKVKALGYTAISWNEQMRCILSIDK